MILIDQQNDKDIRFLAKHFWLDLKVKNQLLDATEFAQGDEKEMKMSLADGNLIINILKENVEQKELQDFPEEPFDMFGLKEDIHSSKLLDMRHHNLMNSIDGSNIYRPFIDLKTGKTIPHLFWKSAKDKTISPFRTCYFNKIWSYIDDFQLNDS